jgi:hypothetical protein
MQSTPMEWNSSGPVSPLFDQWLVELTSWSGMDLRPAVFTVVLQAGDVGTEKGSKLPSTS